ncbi:MAG TPA: ATP-binding protein [Thermodesulfovibrionales bacterium]|nr:ATP-binding protein [Thermodesulfovibrionales bacterium]
MTERELPFGSAKTPWQLLLVFFILATLISSVGFLYYQSKKKEIGKDIANELLAIANLKASQIVNWREERFADAATIRDNFLLAPYIQDLVRDPNGIKKKRELVTWMKSFKEAFQYEDILFLNKDGNVLVSIGQSTESMGPVTRKSVSGAIRTRKIIFSDLYRDGITDKVRLDIAVPILNEDKNDTLGVFLLRINPYFFLFPLIETWPTRHTTAETMLVRREGDKVVYLNDINHHMGTALTLRLSMNSSKFPEAMAVEGKEGTVEGKDYQGITVLAGLKSVAKSPWYIIAKIDEEEVYAPVRKDLWYIILVIGLCTFSAGTVVILIWRNREEQEQKAYRESLETTVRERTAALEQANYQLKEFNDDLESFSYSVSHDLRQPLIVIEGFARSLIKRYGGKLDDYGKDNLSIIRDQASKMTRFINDLLSFCRASTKDVQKSEINVELLAKTLVEEMKPTIGERTVQCEVRELPVIWGDPSMIRQVMVNLLSNALKYTRTRDIARIEIGSIEREEGNIYYVKDNGVGFDNNKATNLFSMFHRLHSSEKFEGTGIGLVVTKRVVNKHGGKIWAEGKVNEGATFYFMLPRKS